MGMAQKEFRVESLELRMRKIFLVILFLLALSPHQVFAESSYVLPYPSSMPGSVWYTLHLVQERLEKFWYFGNYGQFSYNLKQADKYLVEAKTLFEYKQYLLADRALGKSDEYFQRLPYYLENAKKENRDISAKMQLLKDASSKHIEILTSLKKDLPDTFNWKPERKSATELNLKEKIENSIKIRERIKSRMTYGFEL